MCLEGSLFAYRPVFSDFPPLVDDVGETVHRLFPIHFIVEQRCQWTAVCGGFVPRQFHWNT